MVNAVSNVFRRDKQLLAFGAVTSKAPERSTAASRCAPRSCGACVVGARRASVPFQSHPGSVAESARPTVGRCGTLRPAPLAAAALRVARDRPFRAGFRSSRCGSCRAKVYVPSTPALHPFGSFGPRHSRPRRTWLRRGERGMRWALAPGGSARGAGWGHLMQARSRSRPVGRSRRRERERADGSVGRCRRKTAM